MTTENTRKKKTPAVNMKGIRPYRHGYKVEVMVKGLRKSTVAHTIEEAVLRRQQIYDELQGQLPESERPAKALGWTLKQATEKTFHLHWRGTADEDKQRLRTAHLLEFFGEDCPVQSITAERIIAFREWAEQTYKNGQNTINKKVRALSRILRLAFDLGKLDRVPKLHMAPIKPTRIKFLTHEEESTLLDHFQRMTTQEHTDALIVLLDTGFRLGELWLLEAENVNPRTGTVSLWDGTTKNGFARTVPMTGRVREVLERRSRQYPTGPLWPLTQRNKNNWFEHQWDRVRKALNKLHDKDWVPHMLRHTCCSRLVQAGVNLFLVQQWMGHRSLTITQRYAHHAPHHLVSAGQALEAFNSPQPLTDKAA